MHILGERIAASCIADDLFRFIDELARCGDDRHCPNGIFKTIDRTEDLEIELRQAVAKALQRHTLKDNIGDAAIGGRITATFFGFKQTVRQLVFCAPINADRETGLVEFLAVGPNSADSRYLALANGIGEVGVIIVFDPRCLLRTASTAPASTTAQSLAAARWRLCRCCDDVFFKLRRPYELAWQSCPAINARDVPAFG